MNSLQPIRFNSVKEFLDYLPENERTIVNILRSVVLEMIPGCREKLAYNVPFFYKKSRICFIWPSSVPWGNVALQGVQFGFCKGYLLNDRAGYLDKGSRKEVSTRTFFSPDEIDTDLLKSYLYDAFLIDSCK